MKIIKLSLAALLAVALATPAVAKHSSRLRIENANPVSLEVTAEGRGQNVYLGRIPAGTTKAFHLDRGDYKVTATTRYGDELTQTVHVNRSGAFLKFERAPGDQVSGRYDHSEAWYRKWGTGDWNWRLQKSQ